MSLLHGVKKRTMFIIATIIMVASGVVLCGNTTLAATDPQIMLNRAKVKSIVGAVARCLDQNNGNDYDVNSMKLDGSIDDAESIDGMQPGYNMGLYYLSGGNTKKSMAYSCREHINFIEVVKKISELTGKPAPDVFDGDQKQAEWLLDHVYTITQTGDHNGTTRENVIDCLLKRGEFYDKYCRGDNDYVDLDRFNKTDEVYNEPKFLYWIRYYYSDDGFNPTSSLSKGEVYLIAEDYVRTEIESARSKYNLLETTEDMADAYYKCYYRKFDSSTSEWRYYKFHNPSNTKCDENNLPAAYFTDDSVINIPYYSKDDGMGQKQIVDAQVMANGGKNYMGSMTEQHSYKDHSDYADYITAGNDLYINKNKSDCLTEYSNLNFYGDDIPTKNKGIMDGAIIAIDSAYGKRTDYNGHEISMTKFLAPSNETRTENINGHVITVKRTGVGVCLVNEYHADVIAKYEEELKKASSQEDPKEWEKKCKEKYSLIRNQLTTKLRQYNMLPYNDSYAADHDQGEESKKRYEMQDWINTNFPVYQFSDYEITKTNSPEPNAPVAYYHVINNTAGRETYDYYEITYPTAHYLTVGTIIHKECIWQSLANDLTKLADAKVKEIFKKDSDIHGDLDQGDDEYGGAFDDWTAPEYHYDGPTYDDPDTPTTPAEYKPDTCYDNSGSLGWILCPLISSASGIGSYMWGVIEQDHLKLPSSALFGVLEGSEEPGLHVAWSRIRDLTNICFVIVFLIVVLSQITSIGLKNYDIKKMLPKLIVAIIVVNLSYYACQLAIDLSNTFGVAIRNMLQNIASGIPWSLGDYGASQTMGSGTDGFITGALITGAAAGIFALILSMTVGKGFGAAIAGLGLLVLGLVIVIVVAIATLYITLIIREAAIVMGIVVAPMALMCNVLPNTQNLFKKWLSLMKALLVLYPLCSFVIGCGELAGAVLAATGINSLRLAAGVVQVIPYFFVPSLLKKSLAGLGNVGARLGALGKNWGHRASNAAKSGIKNLEPYKEAMARSRRNAAERQSRLYNSLAAHSRTRRGRDIANRIAAKATKEVEDYDNKSLDSGVFNREGAHDERMLQAATDRTTKDDTQRDTWSGVTGEQYAQGKINANRLATAKNVTDTIHNTDATYLAGVQAQNEAASRKAFADTSQIGANAATYEAAMDFKNAEDRAKTLAEIQRNSDAQAQAGIHAENQVSINKALNDARRIGRNAEMYTSAMNRKNEMSSRNDMDQLAATWGGGEFGADGHLMRNPDGTYVTNEQNARNYERGARSMNAISSYKDQQDKINQGEHAKNLFRANAIRNDIDRDIQTRNTEAFVNDYVDPHDGHVYRALDYQNNYKQQQENKLNSTLAAGHTAPLETTFSQAYSQNQQKINSELLKQYQTQYENSDSATLIATASSFTYNPATQGSRQEAAALVSSLIKANHEDEAQTLLNRVTDSMSSVAEEQELLHSIDAGNVAGIKAMQSAVTKFGAVHSYSNFMSNTGFAPAGASVAGAGDLSFSALAAKKDNKVTTMDSDSISYANSLLQQQINDNLGSVGLSPGDPGAAAIAATVRQNSISGIQALHNVLTVQKDKAQTNMRDIIEHTDPAEFANLPISGSDITSSLNMAQLQNLKLIADRDLTGQFRDKIQRIMGNLTPQKQEGMDPERLKYLLTNFPPKS